MSALEQDVIRDFAPEYNQTIGGEIRGMSPETREKLAASQRGRRKTPEQKAAMSAFKLAQYQQDNGLLERARANMKVIRAKIDLTVRAAAVRAALTGKKHTPESREKMSAACIGRRRSAEVIERVAAKKRKHVECVELGICFLSFLDAAAFLNLSNGNIGRVCDGTRKTCGGMTFRYT